jgi:hypothetical protein
MDPDTRRLVMFAGGLGAVLVVLIGVSSLTGRRSGEVPVVAADNRPVREKPVNPGGMKIDAAENDVFSGVSDTAGARLAPAPESPDATALRTPLASLPPPPPGAAAASTPAVAEAPPISAPIPAPAEPEVVAAVPPAPRPAAAKPAVAATEVHPPAMVHEPIVQLAALTSEEAARSEWAQLAKKMPDLLNDRQPTYSRTQRDGHTFWRVRTSGFADVAQARKFCDRVRAKGAGCSVADF